ncbi:MAG: AAA family ATPase [Thermoproteales archaeon]|nr:AAA family ATPase [Thermoproteales archaeon]
MIIFASGISGSDKISYLKKVSSISSGTIDIIDVGDLMFKKSQQLGIEIPEGKILDLDPLALDYLRAVTFEEILRIINNYRGTEGHELIISTHTCFRWKKHLMPAFNFYYLNKINPDIYITILDNAQFIWARLQRSQWKNRLSLKDILVWRDEETFITEMLAEYQKKPFYIISRNEPPELLKDIIINVEKAKKLGKKQALKAYLSYPITYMKGDSSWMERKEHVKKQLREAGIVVFDPISIEEADVIGLAEEAKSRNENNIPIKLEDDEEILIPIEEIEKSKEDILDQIVARDYKLIEQSDVIIVFYPVTTLSPGVLSEINYGFTHNKEVYAIFPYRSRSPFFDYYTTAVFENVESLIEYFRENKRLI